MNRRDFLGRAAAAPLFVPARAFGANDRIRVGFIGLGGRARWLLGYALPGAEVVAVADCFLPRCQEAAAKHPDGAKWAQVPGLPQDVREGETGRGLRRNHHPCPRVVRHARAPGRPGRLRRKAADPHRGRRAHPRARRAQVQARPADRHPAALHAHQHPRQQAGARGRHRQGAYGGGLQFPGAAPLEAPGRAARSRGARLEPVVQPDRAAALPQGSAPPLGDLARLRRRRAILGRQRLGHPRARPGAGGPRHGRYRPRRDLARGARPRRQGDAALCQRHAADAWRSPRSPTTRNSAPSSSATRGRSRSCAAISSPTRRS